MSKFKGQLTGILICLACIVIGVLYGYALYTPKFRIYAIAIPVVLAFYTLIAIGFWIGTEMVRSTGIEEEIKEPKKSEKKKKRK